jgi:hypothetical protein
MVAVAPKVVIQHCFPSDRRLLAAAQVLPGRVTTAAILVALIALDSNLVDLFEEACSSSEHVDAMEAMEPPPRFREMLRQQEA